MPCGKNGRIVLSTPHDNGTAGGKDFMNGYAIYGQPPVLRDTVETTRGVVVKREAREAAYDNLAGELVAEVVERDLAGDFDSIHAVYETCGYGTPKKLDDLLRDLDADNLDDWLRLMAACPVADQPVAALNMQEWMLKLMHQQPWAIQKAENLAARKLKL